LSRFGKAFVTVDQVDRERTSKSPQSEAEASESAIEAARAGLPSAPSDKYGGSKAALERESETPGSASAGTTLEPCSTNERGESAVTESL